MLALIVLLFIGDAGASVERDILNLYRQSFKGEGTYYGSQYNGTCQYEPPARPPVGTHSVVYSTVALNTPQFLNSMACGMCFKVKANGVGSGANPIRGQFIVFVDNLCSECKSGFQSLTSDCISVPDVRGSRLLTRLTGTAWVMGDVGQWEKPVMVPLRIELTAANGRVVLDSIPSIVNGVIIRGLGRQFPLDPKLPSA